MEAGGSASFINISRIGSVGWRAARALCIQMCKPISNGNPFNSSGTFGNVQITRPPASSFAYLAFHNVLCTRVSVQYFIDDGSRHCFVVTKYSAAATKSHSMNEPFMCTWKSTGMCSGF